MDIDDLLTNRLKLSFMEKIYASNLNAEDYRKFIIPKIQDQFSPGMTFYIGSISKIRISFTIASGQQHICS